MLRRSLQCFAIGSIIATARFAMVVGAVAEVALYGMMVVWTLRCAAPSLHHERRFSLMQGLEMFFLASGCIILEASHLCP